MDHKGIASGGGAADGLDELVEGFSRYLVQERALSATTVENYLNQVRPFVAWWGRQGGSVMAGLTMNDVNRFLAWRSQHCSPGSMAVVATALRAWLRWLFLVGHVEQQFSEGIGPVRYSALTGLPQALSEAELQALLAVGASLRDRALVLLLARLGLRSAEVAALSLEDVNWREATVRICGKADDHQLMPLPADVGQALAAYLSDEHRRSATSRKVFLAAASPYGPLGRKAISSVVTRMAHRAGIQGRVGAHRLRHSAATAVLDAGGTLGEAGQLLRHRSVGATAVYAKVDNDALAGVIRPWPATSGRQG